ncbi:MAG: sporulation protein YqfD [Clostridia bacterium]
MQRPPHNQTEYVVKGLNLEKVLNKICQNFTIFNIKKIAYNKFKFTCDFENRKAVLKILEARGFKLEKSNNYGFLALSNAFAKRIGLVVAIPLVISLLFLLNSFVFQVAVLGNSNISKTQIAMFLKQQNIKLPISKSQIDTKVLESKIEQYFDNISMASVIKKGTTLVISAKSGAKKPEKFGPIISSANGKIKEIKVIKGTLNVKKNQIVKAGQILVLPYVVSTDGTKTPVLPKAEIVLTAWLTGKLTHNENQVQNIKTGKSSQILTLKLFGKNISKNGKNNFKMFEVKKNISKPFGNNILPIILEREIFYEIQQKIVFVPFAQVKQVLEKKSKEIALLNLQKHDIIEKEFVSNDAACGINIITYTVEVTRKIG